MPRARKSAQRADSTGATVGYEAQLWKMADALRGLFEMVIAGKPRVVEYEPDTELRDSEQIPFLECQACHQPGYLPSKEDERTAIEAFLRREVLPYAPDAWYDPASVKLGYEINFNRYFYKPQPLRSLEEIRADILALEKETEGLLGEIIGATGDAT